MGSNTLKFLWLLCLVSGYSALDHKDEEWVFQYSGNISSYSSLTELTTSTWGLRAKVTVQGVEKFAVIQLDNIETIAYNGHNIEDTEIKYGAAPTEAEVLTKPFTVHFHDGLVESISIHPDDTLWSVNMKRSIASMFQIDEKLPKVVTEKHVYGECKTTYDFTKTDDSIVLKKFFTNTNCEESPETMWKNAVNFDCSEDHGDRHLFERNITREYNVEKVDGKWVVKHIEAESKVLHRTMPTETIYHIIHETQVFDLIHQGKIEKHIDYSLNTVKKSITFESDSDLTQGRRNQQQNMTEEEVIESWYESANELEKQWEEKALPSLQLEHFRDYVDEMYVLMADMNYDTFSNLHLKIQQEKDHKKENIFSSLIPLIGTEDSIKFIKNFFKKEVYNDILGMQILSTFPMYTNSPSEDLLKEMEFLLDLKDVSNNVVKHSGILSFSYLVSDTYKSEKCSKEVYDSYIQKYFKLFMEATEYRLRLVYLQGLLNMDVEPSVLTAFIRNNKESHHLRVVAIYAIKRQLHNDNEKTFKMFWPMVKDIKQHLEIRVAALDVIIDGFVSRENLQTVIDTIKYDDDLYNQHLYNYLYTTFDSVSNETYCSDHLAKYMDLIEIEEPESDKIWITGKYRAGFTDYAGNHGIMAEAQLIGDPITNVVNSIYFEFDRFALGLNYGQFAVYFKFEGIADHIFDEIFLSSVKKAKSVPELVTIIQKTNLKLKNLEEMHVEIIVYLNNKAVFAAHVTPENIREYTDLFKQFVNHSESHQAITYPVMDYVYSTSDLGTLLTKRIEVKTSFSQDYIPFFQNMKEAHENSVNIRTSWMGEVALESYNPIADVDFGTSKFHKSESLVSFAYTWDPEKSMFTFKDNEGSAYYNTAIDHFVVTFVTELDYLKKYCEDCVDIYIVSTDQHIENDESFSLEFIGKDLKVEVSNCSEMPNMTEEIKKYYKPKEIYGGFYVALPFLLGTFMSDSAFYMTPWEACSVNMKLVTAYDEPVETTLQFIHDSSDVEKAFTTSYQYLETTTVAFTQKKKDGGDLLRFWNFTFNTEEDKSSLNQVFNFRLNNIFTDGTKDRFCFDTEVHYPTPHSDLYSMQAVDPTTSKIHISYGEHDLHSNSCPKDTTIDISNVYSVLYEQKELAEKATTEPFKTCKEESAGLKYLAPTESCFRANQKMSSYRNYFTNIQIQPVPEWLNETIEAIEFLFAFASDEEIFNGTDITTEFHDAGNINMSAVFYVVEPKVVFSVNTHDLELDFDSEDNDFVEALLMSPDNEYQNDELVDLGIQSTCTITPTTVTTYLEKEIKDYEPNLNVKKVGVIECMNQTRYGLVFHKVNDKQMSFTLWSQDDKLIVTPKEDGLTVVLNGEEITKDTHTDLSVKFLEDDVLYIEDDLQTVYYNKEYIQISTYSVHLNKMCGICSPQEENVTVV